MKKYHLVILKKPYLEAILAGRKKVESRLTKTKRPYFEQVDVGDKLFLKVSSGPVCATATVSAVKTFEDLTPQKITEIKQRYNHLILGAEEPVRINKKDWRAWVLLTNKQNFNLLKTRKNDQQ